ncbi:sulfite exporter TauE/SafE family protein [Aquabacterium fontiphilum]|uniref:sulfite exporter TauE/SafE family protein n=1 Tax=Aquabacterium fontiphilum TaxID=450365 RepID=UPI001378C934|nr:sulfite exporter TauE/SafE family protein [Aquabacterium fontiphilum]
MLSSLLLTALLMGLGGMAHCAAMCGAACAVAMPGGVPIKALIGRSLGYAMLGALAAASAGVIAQVGRQVAFLQPFWIMLLVAAVVLGLWLVVTGRMPQRLDHAGLTVYRRVRARWQAFAARHVDAPWAPATPLLAGALWAFLPCGLLYAALMVAALAPNAAGGAAVMLTFSLPSAVGVWAAPWVLGRLLRRTDGASGAASGAVAPVLWAPRAAATASAVQPASRHTSDERLTVSGPARPASPLGALVDPRWAVRAAGAGLAAMAAWAVSHHVWAQYQAWCA